MTPWGMFGGVHNEKSRSNTEAVSAHGAAPIDIGEYRYVLCNNCHKRRYGHICSEPYQLIVSIQARALYVQFWACFEAFRDPAPSFYKRHIHRLPLNSYFFEDFRNRELLEHIHDGICFGTQRICRPRLSAEK